MAQPMMPLATFREQRAMELLIALIESGHCDLDAVDGIKAAASLAYSLADAMQEVGVATETPNVRETLANIRDLVALELATLSGDERSVPSLKRVLQLIEGVN